MKTIHSPGVVPTFEIGFSAPTSDFPPGLDTWRGFPGNVGYANRFTFIDEAVPDDSDYISPGLGNAGSIFLCSCGAPVLGAGHITVSFRVRRMGGTGTFTAFLRTRRGGVEIHVESIANINPNIPLIFTTVAIALSPAEIAALYGGAGQMEMGIDCAGGPGTDAVECSWMHIDYFP